MEPLLSVPLVWADLGYGGIGLTTCSIARMPEVSWLISQPAITLKKRGFVHVMTFKYDEKHAFVNYSKFSFPFAKLHFLYIFLPDSKR